MNCKMLSAGSGLWVLGIAAGFGVPAIAVAETPHASAADACAVVRDGEPATPIAAIDDGRGGSLVWLTDADANLWLCSADASGRVFAYSMIFNDLLGGAGASLAQPIYIGSDGKPIPPAQDPLAVAERACQAYLQGEPGRLAGKVVGKGGDGLNANWLPGYFVFIETDAGETFLCDATANAQVWAFAKIGEPLSLGNPVG